MRRGRIMGGIALLAMASLYLVNASWLAPAPTGTPLVYAQRGIYQRFSHDSLSERDCTATRMLPPTNPYLENTLPSIRAAFDAGAGVTSLAIHPTTDGEFAVFHDWGLDCRTNGHGDTRKQSMRYLKSLDIGYGYTADGGRTFPFRGKGIGLMPTLHEALTAFPGKRFIITFKSNDASEANKLVAYLKAHHDPVDGRLWAIGGDRPIDRLHQLVPQARVSSKQRMKFCSIGYLALGWGGHVPETCRGGFIVVPLNWRWAYWGWPNRFLDRMRHNDVVVMLAGRMNKGAGLPSLSNAADLDAVPRGFSGLIVTDTLETIGPEVRRRWPEQQSLNAL
jgi:glycerophosphoryl diester phosphodiesterase